MRRLESDIAALLLLDLDVLAEPGKTLEDAYWEKFRSACMFGVARSCTYALLTLSAGGTTGLDLPDVVLGYPVEIKCLGYVVGSHGCRV